MAKKTVLLGVLLASLSMCANAADTWTGYKKITQVQIVQNGGFILYFDSEVNPTCKSSAGTSALYVYPGQGGITSEGIKSYLSAALTAFTAGLTVGVMYDDATPNCWLKYLRVMQ